MGPAPTRPPADPPAVAADPSRHRLLRVLAGHREGPAPTVSDLATLVGGHPNTTRHHLRALVTAGLVEVERTPRAGGRGRPATRYAVTQAGRDAASPRRPAAAAEEYVALAAAFATRLSERDGDPGADARAIGNAWGAGLVAQDDRDALAGADGIPPSPTERVTGLLDRLGFSPVTDPAFSPVTDPGADRAVLLRTCPLVDAARRHPEVVCEVHLGLVAGALEALGEPSEGLRLEPFARPGACVLTMPTTQVG